MARMYICTTPYQLLLTILKIEDDKSELVLLEGTTDKEIISNLSREKVFKKIDTLNMYIFDEIKRYITNKREIARFITRFKEADDIYIYNDHIPIGWTLDKNKIKYNLIEDGYNFFSYKYIDFRNRVFTKKATIRDYKDLLKHLFFLRRTKGPGFSKYCQSIEVNDISVVPKDERYHKFKEVPRKDLFNNISEERKQLILRVFDVEELSEVAEKSVLILTQPLSLDGLLNSDEKQYGFYKKICDKYLSEGYKVYLKPHPRDTITYEKINGVNLITQSVPMELIEMVSNVKFERIITHSSTAINFLTCGEEKEVFYDFNTREYDEKLLEKYNINKDEL
ncbi:glycosyltransferase family 52 [Gemella sp.]